ncbi:hypothetical protein D047_4726A, partial [Vibrio parahaemolyticus VPTS-2010_2]
MVNNATTQ